MAEFETASVVQIDENPLMNEVRETRRVHAVDKVPMKISSLSNEMSQPGYWHLLSLEGNDLVTLSPPFHQKASISVRLQGLFSEWCGRQLALQAP